MLSQGHESCQPTVFQPTGSPLQLPSLLSLDCSTLPTTQRRPRCTGQQGPRGLDQQKLGHPLARAYRAGPRCHITDYVVSQHSYNVQYSDGWESPSLSRLCSTTVLSIMGPGSCMTHAG